MIGILVQLAISWLFIWLIEKKNLGVLGFLPTSQRLLDFVFFFLITAICCTSGFLLSMYFKHERWELNPHLSFGLFASGLWWNLKSVVFEELIFRGVLLYILIKRIGAIKAIIVSAIAFGIYHWFSYGIIGNVQQMIIYFIITGFMGLVLAYGYAKTFSLYVPIAIHSGWNFTQIFIFSSGPIGDGLLVKVSSETNQTVSVFAFLLMQIFPLLSALVVNFVLLKKHEQARKIFG